MAIPNRIDPIPFLFAPFVCGILYLVLQDSRLGEIFGRPGLAPEIVAFTLSAAVAIAWGISLASALFGRTELSVSRGEVAVIRTALGSERRRSFAAGQVRRLRLDTNPPWWFSLRKPTTGPWSVLAFDRGEGIVRVGLPVEAAEAQDIVDSMQAHLTTGAERSAV